MYNQYYTKQLYLCANRENRKGTVIAMKTNFILPGLAFLVSIVVMLQFPACGTKTTPYDENLLSNPSFEDVRNGIPEGWSLETFHGLENSKTVVSGVSDEEAFGGKKSFYFQGGNDTQRWLTLAQEIRVSPDVTHVRLRGALKRRGVERMADQYTHCNLVLMFYDKNHERFQELRYADKRTRFKAGTSDWELEDHTFRVANNTAYIAVGCVMGMTGTVWFDELSLTVPRPAGWVKQSTKNFDFYSLPGHGYPEGALESEQQMFDFYCKQLTAADDMRLSYYLYPDSTTIQEMLSLNGVQYISWDDREIHTIFPNNDHEIVHFITDQYGVAPKAIAEGCVYYLQGGWNGRPSHVLARELLLGNQLPLLSQLLNYGDLVDLDVNLAMPAAASFFGFLYEQKGPRKILELFRAVNGANSYPTFAVAFEKVYQIELGEAEKRWRAFLFSVPVDSENTGQSQP